MNKQYSLVKRLKREITDELVKDIVQEECSTQSFEEPVYEEVREVFHGNQEQISENAEEDQRSFYRSGRWEEFIRMKSKLHKCTRKHNRGSYSSKTER